MSRFMFGNMIEQQYIHPARLVGFRLHIRPGLMDALPALCAENEVEPDDYPGLALLSLDHLMTEEVRLLGLCAQYAENPYKVKEKREWASQLDLIAATRKSIEKYLSAEGITLDAA